MLRQFITEKSTVYWLICVLLIIFKASAYAQEYTINAGDRIKIQVFGEEDLSIETLVDDSGFISYPFLGSVNVKRKKVKEIEEDITKKLKDGYLVKPEVTVSILEYRQFYVNGWVKSPGGFAFNPYMTVRKAISLAGGFEERANEGKITVVRGDNANAKPVPIKLDDYVQPGDILTVERSFF